MATTGTVTIKYQGLNRGGPIPCGYCTMRFPNERCRRKHVNRSHQPELRHKCPYCERRFEQPRALQTHCGQQHSDRYVRAKDHRGMQRDWNLRTKYGITSADFDAMLAGQGGGCAVCGELHADSRGLRLHVDHDHASGRVRGLLCGNCNMALGKAHDDPARLRALADYLEAR